MFTINKRLPVFFTGSLLCLALVSCSSDERLPDLKYTFEQPEDFPKATYTFENNPVTREGFELGRMLFYDPILSVDSTVSCSSCHKQATAFADPTHKINHGVHNRFGKRNSSGLGNMAFMDAYFYDGGVNHLDFVPINAITSDVEMGNTLNDLVKRLNNNKLYRDKFTQAFKQEEINSQQLLHALAQFTLMLVSADSKYDNVMLGRDQFSPPEQQGYILFQEKCSSCHAGELFTDQSFRNNGIDSDFTKDAGRAIITELEDDRGKFKVPGLRNITLTPPYMHDGRFRTLEDVLDHYRSGVKNSPSLDAALHQEGVLGIKISDAEKEKIITFLKTLTDTPFTKDKRFTDPF